MSFLTHRKHTCPQVGRDVCQCRKGIPKAITLNLHLRHLSAFPSTHRRTTMYISRFSKRRRDHCTALGRKKSRKTGAEQNRGALHSAGKKSGEKRGGKKNRKRGSRGKPLSSFLPFALNWKPWWEKSAEVVISHFHGPKCVPRPPAFCLTTGRGWGVLGLA